jgi:GNAT superfamily N-acetyltransferase
MMSDGDTDRSARSLADAFADDPVMGWAGKFDDDRDRLVPFWKLIIDFRLRKSDPLLFTTEYNQANAVWDAPGDADIATIDLVKGLPSMTRSFRTGVPRLFRMIQAMDKAHPKEPHYYLLAIGVSRAHQGKGVGSTVIQPMLDRCDQEGLPAYLENSKPENEAFYARHGFERRGTLDLPAGCPPLMPMWRTPR